MCSKNVHVLSINFSGLSVDFQWLSRNFPPLSRNSDWTLGIFPYFLEISLCFPGKSLFFLGIAESFVGITDWNSRVLLNSLMCFLAIPASFHTLFFQRFLGLSLCFLEIFRCFLGMTEPFLEISKCFPWIEEWSPHQDFRNLPFCPFAFACCDALAGSAGKRGSLKKTAEVYPDFLEKILP